ncbi:hypothetical protein [Endobacterium cereale]|uniref:hypothetical protein n=1 Tax=Endobacterium cereale TaxID=2663029 RepID=UPI002B48BE31|nr:hypothetical protein [Endobacterium cereale]MEB2845978.1 hypothetical protein [Endobacterium cereale]
MSTAETTVLPAPDEFAGMKDVERKSREDAALETRQRSTSFKIRLTRCRRLDNGIARQFLYNVAGFAKVLPAIVPDLLFIDVNDFHLAITPGWFPTFPRCSMNLYLEWASLKAVGAFEKNDWAP